MPATSRYDVIGRAYGRYRRPDPRIARSIHAALGDAKRVVNVGAGTGSYEPTDRALVAVEPSSQMILQRAIDSAPVVRASAESLPFADGAFDASLAVLTVHHWADRAAGLAELRRVARDRIVLVTWDPSHPGFWLVRDYFPGLLETDRLVFPSLRELAAILGPMDVRVLPIFHDCTDGFLGAYWRRPAAYLDDGARSAISTFARIADPTAGLDHLRVDLHDGTWVRRNADLLGLEQLDVGYRLVVARGAT